MHEALRASLLRYTDDLPDRKSVPGRPRNERRKSWRRGMPDTDVRIGSDAFMSLRTVGPFPWTSSQGLLLPVPLDVTRSVHDCHLHRFQLWMDPTQARTPFGPSERDPRPPCLPLATTPPDKNGILNGWWTIQQMAAYLDPKPGHAGSDFSPVPTENLWQPEYRVGVTIHAHLGSACHGGLYAGTYLRMQEGTRFAVDAQLGGKGPRVNEELKSLTKLSWILLGGDRRLAELQQLGEHSLPADDPFASLRKVPVPHDGVEGPLLLKWVLVTPAIFSRGHFPGWCVDTRRPVDGPLRPVGRVCLKDLPGKAHLISWCLGRPRTVSGWDAISAKAKATQLAVPEGSVFYFLCEDRPTAEALARMLHWTPRSDHFGEKGCGYGLVSYRVETHRMSANVRELASRIFNP